ncbi:MAG: RdgB/HAM1 family non-canonical purine NTP pyrophosphatase [Candidatus Omnitrophica bacterium]|nr:RdgB/HAM1 family non-canonical purine NTP pyrophosphatase [Candidatus Omnitrophota bacterium]
MPIFDLIIATKNKKKLKEIKEILKDFRVRIISLSDLHNAPRIVENGSTFKANAIKKAVKIAHFSGKLTLGEDSGLCIDALGNKPGIYSSRFSGKNKSDRQNNLKVMRLMEGLPLSKRKAHYTCAVALASKEGLIGVVEGQCFGLIDFQMKGRHGFGYDPLFLIPKYGKTFGQLSERIKHKMSHRYKALLKARRIIEKYIEKNKVS